MHPVTALFRKEEESQQEDPTPRRLEGQWRGIMYPHLLSLQDLGRRELNLSAENPVPETTGHSKTVIEISKVMLKVIFLELLVVRR